MPRKNPFGSSHVEKRGGVFYFRFTFPAHVATLFGRRGVRLSLRTAYRHTAHQRAASMLHTVSRIIAPLNGHKGIAMEQLRAHLDDELREMVEAWTDHHLGRKRPMERDEIDETEELYSLLRSECMEAKASGDWRRWSDRAATFIEHRGLDYQPESDDFRRLCMELGEIETRFFDVIQSRLLGDYSPHPALPVTTPIQAPQPAYASSTGPASGMPAEKAAMSLSEVMEHYFQFKINGGAWKDPQRARNNDYGPPVRAFIKRLDDKAIGDLVRSDVLNYFDWMTGRTDIGATTQKLQMERVGMARCSRCVLKTGCIVSVRCTGANTRSVGTVWMYRILYRQTVVSGYGAERGQRAGGMVTCACTKQPYPSSASHGFAGQRLNRVLAIGGMSLGKGPETPVGDGGARALALMAARSQIFRKDQLLG